MLGRKAVAICKDIDTLFHVGAVTGTGDGELLERFSAGRIGSGQAAFEEIVRRHGAMVLGVCRRVLSDRQAAEDAFQATFLVLALRAGSIRKRESLGPWLHGVATRMSRRGAGQARRRREYALAGEHLAAPCSDEPDLAELRSVLDEELQRLPENYRRPVVLCYLEGQTQEEAARALGWTKGTVSGRLARAKDLLRTRLNRRGLAPTAAVLPALFATESASGAVPPSLVAPTVRAAAALGLAGAEASSASGHAMNLARDAIRAMFLGRIKVAAAFLVLALGASAVAAAGLWSSRLAFPSPSRAPELAGSPLHRLSQHVVGVAYAPDGKTALSVESDGLVRFWDASSRRQTRTLRLLESPGGGVPDLGAFALSGDRRLIAVSGSVRGGGPAPMGQGVWIWSLEDRRLLRRIEAGEIEPQAMAFSPENASLATGNQSGRIQLWDIASGEELLTLQLGGIAIRGVAFSPDGMTLAITNGSSGVQFWDLGGGRPLGAVDGGSGPRALGPCFSGDGKLLGFGTPAGEVTIWNIPGRQSQVKTRLAARGSLALTFAPDCRTLAVSGELDGTITVIDAMTGRERWRSDFGPTPIAAGLAYSPDGRTIVMAGGDVPRFIDAETGRLHPAR